MYSTVSTVEFLQDEVARLSNDLERAMLMLEKYTSKQLEAKRAMDSFQTTVLTTVNEIDSFPQSVFTELSDDDLDTMESWIEALAIKFQQTKRYHVQRRQDIVGASVRVVGTK
jgi:cytochrome c553